MIKRGIGTGNQQADKLNIPDNSIKNSKSLQKLLLKYIHCIEKKREREREREEREREREKEKEMLRDQIEERQMNSMNEVITIYYTSMIYFYNVSVKELIGQLSRV